MSEAFAVACADVATAQEMALVMKGHEQKKNQPRASPQPANIMPDTLLQRTKAAEHVPADFNGLDVQKMLALPVIGFGCVPHLVLTWACFGNIDKKSGKMIFEVLINDNCAADGTPAFHFRSLEEPTQRFAEYVLSKVIFLPRTPRPHHVLFAHRTGKVYEAIAVKLSAAGIQHRIESRAYAEALSQRSKTDLDGFNYRSNLPPV